jgi:hypothetical protein
METTRRDFLKLLGLGATGVTLSASGLYLPEQEPIRRYWQVGAQLQKNAELPPGHIRVGDRIVSLRDFTESDKYNTVLIQDTGHAQDTTLTFEKPPNPWNGGALVAAAFVLAQYGVLHANFTPIEG